MIKIFFFKFISLVILINTSKQCDFQDISQIDCEYIKQNCSDNDAIFDYLAIYFCHITSTPIYILLISLWIASLFYMLFLIADQNFTISLQHISDYLRLSPDLAGITLLAFGNGAPDFFTALAGADESPQLVVGSSLSSTICILSMIFGMVLWYGQDYQSDEKGMSEIESSGKLNQSLLIKQNNNKKSSILISNSNSLKLESSLFIRNYILLFLSLSAFIAIILINTVYFVYPLLLVIWYVIYIIWIVLKYIYDRNQQIQVVRNIELQEIESLIDHQSKEESKQKEIFNGSFMDAFFVLNSFSEKTKLQWMSFIFQSIPCLVVKLVILPLGLTNDDSDELNLKQQLATLKFQQLLTVLNPLFSGALIFIIFERDFNVKYGQINAWIIYLIISIAVSVLIYFTNQKNYTHQPKLFFFRVLYVFVMCIICLYQTSTELVEALVSISFIYGIPKDLLGLTVLAWGNSFQDLVSNLALAKQGQFQTVATSMFASPLQNILLTIGANFLIVALKSDDHQIVIGESDNLIQVSIGFQVVIMLLIGIFVYIFKFNMPRRLGIFLVSYYILFILSLVVTNSF